MVFEGIWAFVTSNPLTAFNSILLVTTAYLSVSSYKFQTRAGIRESLEQLDDLDLGEEKFSPVLYEVKHRLFWKSRAVVQLKYYQFGKEPAAAARWEDLFNVTLSKMERGLDLKEDEYFSESAAIIEIQNELMELHHVDNVYQGTQGFRLEIDSINALRIRRTVEIAFGIIHSWHHVDGTEYVKSENETAKPTDFWEKEELRDSDGIFSQFGK